MTNAGALCARYLNPNKPLTMQTNKPQSPVTRAHAPENDAPIYANLWDMVNARTMRDDMPDSLETLDYSLSIEVNHA